MMIRSERAGSYKSKQLMLPFVSGQIVGFGRVETSNLGPAGV